MNDNETKTDSVDQEKKQVRAVIQKKLSFLTAAQRESASNDIFKCLVDLPGLQTAKTVYCFISIRQEPDTRPIIEYLLKSGKRVCVPKCKSHGIMDARVITSFDDLKPMPPFGIPEPPDQSEIADPATIDFAIVPGLAFDRKGGRLGRGMGYYDRYLSGCAAYRCGVCFDALLFEQIPTGSMDVPMDTILTEKTLLHLGTSINREETHA